MVAMKMILEADKRKLDKIGREHGLDGVELEIYKDFFIDTFGTRRQEGYMSTWARRFGDGNGFAYMDLDSFRVYLKVLKKQWGRFGFDVDLKLIPRRVKAQRKPSIRRVS